MTTCETTETRRDLHADLLICAAVPEVYYDEGGGYTSANLTEAAMHFFAEAPVAWPEALRRAIAAEEQVGALIELLREACDMIIPNESEYKCDYRRRYITHQIPKIVPEVGADE